MQWSRSSRCPTPRPPFQIGLNLNPSSRQMDIGKFDSEMLLSSARTTSAHRQSGENRRLPQVSMKFSPFRAKKEFRRRVPRQPDYFYFCMVATLLNPPLGIIAFMTNKIAKRKLEGDHSNANSWYFMTICCSCIGIVSTIVALTLCVLEYSVFRYKDKHYKILRDPRRNYTTEIPINRVTPTGSSIHVLDLVDIKLGSSPNSRPIKTKSVTHNAAGALRLWIMGVTESTAGHQFVVCVTLVILVNVLLS